MLTRNSKAASVAAMGAALLLVLAPAPAAGAPLAPRDLTFFLHYVNATETAKVLPGSGSTWTYFDTTDEWNEANVTLVANGSLQTFDWYLAPPLASDVTVTAASFSFWAQFLSGVASGQTTVELSERTAAGVEALVSTGNFGSESYAYTPGLKVLSWTLMSSHTFAAGSSVKFTLKLNLGGGSMAILFDTARADSRVTLTSADALHLTGAQALDAAGTPVATLDPAAPDPRARLRATLQDPFGGYDVAWVRMTLLDEAGAAVFDNATATRVAGTPASLASTYEVVWNYSAMPSGRYVAWIFAMDNSGQTYYEHFANFAYGPHGDSMSFPVFIGGLPFHAWVRVADDRGLPLAGARVTLVESPGRGGEALTDGAGLANLTAAPGLYTLAVVWTGTEVARVNLNLVANISAGSPFEVAAAVHYPTLRIVDNRSAPLTNAGVTYTHPNGSTTLTPVVTDANGTVSLGRTAAGNYRVVVHWGTLIVLDALWAVNSSGEDTLTAAVFYVDFSTLDSRAQGVAFATLVVRDASTGVVLAFTLTDANGTAQARLPGASVDVAVWTRDIQVVDERGRAVSSDGQITLPAAVYYLEVSVVDTGASPVGGALVTVRSHGGTVTETALTQASGTATVRLPGQNYTLTVAWFGEVVASNASVQVASDLTVSVVVSVRSLDLLVVDSRNLPVSAVNLALVSLDATNATVALAVTDAGGRAALHVPEGTFRLLGTWNNATVVDQAVTVAGDTDLTVGARVAYLQVEVVDREGRPLNEVIVAVAPQPSDGGLLVEYTGTNGTASYRLPAGNYTITSRLIATYLLSPIDQTVVNSSAIEGQDVVLRVVMTEFQPAFVATNAFAIGLLFLLAMVGVAAFVYVRYQRPGRPGDDDDEDGAGKSP